MLLTMDDLNLTGKTYNLSPIGSLPNINTFIMVHENFCEQWLDNFFAETINLADYDLQSVEIATKDGKYYAILIEKGVYTSYRECDDPADFNTDGMVFFKDGSDWNDLAA